MPATCAFGKFWVADPLIKRYIPPMLQHTRTRWLDNTPLLVAVTGFALGFMLWASGLDVRLQIWLHTHDHQTFNSAMRVLGELSMGRTQIFGLLALALLALWRAPVPFWPMLRLGGWLIFSQTFAFLALKGWRPPWQTLPAAARPFVQAIPVLAIAGLLQVVLKCVIGRPRPKEILWNGGDPFDPRPFGFDATFWSMPSGHSTSTFAIFMWLALCFPRWRVPLLLVASVFAASRFLAVTPHYLGDVVAGAGLGAAVALALFATLPHSAPNRQAPHP